MGVLIYLPERPQPARDHAAKLAGAAEILFFTGIRYERHDEPVTPATTARPVKRNIGETPRPRRRRG
jgi:hypothetical protein